MVYVVGQIAVQIVGDDAPLQKDLASAKDKVKQWASQKFDAPALRVNTQPTEQAIKRVTSVIKQELQQSGQIAAQQAKNQGALAIISARQASQLRQQDLKETQAAEREKNRTKAQLDQDTLRTRIVALRAETAEAKAQSQAQIKIARETARQSEAIYKAIGRGGQAASNIGQSLTYGVSLPLVALGKAAVEADVRMDSLKRGLVAVSGSSAAAERQLTRLREVAKLPGLGFEEAVRGSVQLQAAGLSAEQSARALMAFGNALATVGKGKESLDLVNLALGQIAASTKVSGQDVRQLVQQLPQLRTMMVKAFGTADTEVLGKMGLDPKVFIQRLTDEFAKLPKVTGGIQNDIENAEDSINKSLARIGGSIARVGAGPLRDVTNEVDHLTDEFSHLSTGAQDSIIKAAIGLAVGGPLLVGLGRVAEAVTSIRNLYLALPGVAAKAAAAETAAATETAVAQEGIAAGLRTKLLPLAAGIRVPIYLALLYGADQLGEYIKNKVQKDIYDPTNKAAAQDLALPMGTQIVGQRNDLRDDILTLRSMRAQRMALKTGGAMPSNPASFEDQTRVEQAYGIPASNLNRPGGGITQIDATINRLYRQFETLGRALPRVSASDKAARYATPGTDGGVIGDKIAKAAWQKQIGLDRKAYDRSCQQLARETVQSATHAFDGIWDRSKNATALSNLRRFQKAGLALPYKPGMALPEGSLLYSETLGTGNGGRSGHVQVIGPNGQRLDQHGVNQFSPNNFQYYVPPPTPKGPGLPQVPDPARQDLQRQYIEATQGKYAAERYQAGLDYQANRKLDPKQAAAVYRKALADIHKEALDDQAAQNKKVETAAEKHHKKMLAEATKYVKDQLAIYNDWYRKSVATGKQVDAANAIDAKNRDFTEAGTPAQFARETANAQAGYRAQLKNPYVDQSAAKAALDKTLAEIEARRQAAQDEADARSPQVQAAKKAAALQKQIDDALAKAQDANDVAHGRKPKALSGDDITRQKYASLGPQGIAQANQLISLGADTAQANAANAKAKKDTEDLTALQKQLRDALEDSQVAYEKSTGHVNRYDDIIARLNLDLKTMTPAERDAANAMLPQIAAVDAATAKMRQYHEMMQQVQGALQNSLANTFEKILSGSKVTFKSVVDDFKGMVIRIIAEAEAAKVAAYVTGKNGLGGALSGILGGKPADPTAPGQQAATAKAPGLAGIVGAGLSLYSATKGGQAATGTVGMPGAGAGGGTDWLGNAAAIAPAFGPHGAAVGAGLSVLDSLFGKKKAASPALPGAPGGMGAGVVPVYVVGIAGMTGGGLPGQPGGGGGLGSILGIASSFIPGGGLLGGIGKGIGHLFHFASGTPSVPGMGATDTVPAYLTPGEMVLSRGMLSGSVPAPALPVPLLLRQLPSAGHAPLVSAFTEALANTQGARPINVNAPVSIGTVNSEADENRLIDNFGRRLEQTMATY